MKDALGHGSTPRNAPGHMQGVLNSTRPIKVKSQVLAHIQANPGGFSVTPKGKQPSGGYMVSVPGRTRIVSESDLAGPNGHAILQDFANRNSDALRQPGAHLGGWTDKETGKTYLDVSHNIGNRNRAISAGKSRNQIAIWDVKHGREIRTGGTGE